MSVKESLQYIRNTGGGASLDTFIDDHEPIGHLLLGDLRKFRPALYELNNKGMMILTEDGNKYLDAA